MPQLVWQSNSNIEMSAGVLRENGWKCELMRSHTEGIVGLLDYETCSQS